MDRSIVEKVERWKTCAVLDRDLTEELLAKTPEELEDAFYRDLSFGTAGLRGILGAGTNRMNVYTVGVASQGLAEYVLKQDPKDPSIVISRDSRLKSDLFAYTAAAIFAMNGIKTYIFKEIMPVPCLSYAVRALGTTAGVMVTASHNPAIYNGYKVYGPDGAQMTEEGADEVFSAMKATDLFNGVRFGDFDALLSEGKIEYVPDAIYDAYTERVKAESVLPKSLQIDRTVAIVYTPLHGAGLKPVTRVLRESGFTNITVVPEQEMPDGHFPTCPYPNPEIRDTMALGMALCEKKQADLLLATDPDSDRLAIAVKKPGGDYVILSGNELGCLLLDYICCMRKTFGNMPENAVAVKSLVSTDLAGKIAEKYGVTMKNVLTGFKYIGDQIALLEERGEEARFIFGFEESCGYLPGAYCRDKDAVAAAFLTAEMFCYYRSIGKGLYERMQEIYAELGYYHSESHAFQYAGMAGQAKMQEIMEAFRAEENTVGGFPVLRKLDYLKGVEGLPKSDVLQYLLPDDASVIVRPSGTEPKVKLYLTVRGESAEEAEKKAAFLYDRIAPAFS